MILFTNGYFSSGLSVTRGTVAAEMSADADKIGYSDFIGFCPVGVATTSIIGSAVTIPVAERTPPIFLLKGTFDQRQLLFPFNDN